MVPLWFPVIVIESAGLLARLREALLASSVCGGATERLATTFGWVVDCKMDGLNGKSYGFD